MLPTMRDLPQLVVDDPWLEPFTEPIRQRCERFDRELREIESRHGSLQAFATGHLLTGIHQEPDGHWMIREWLPKAKAVFLIGDFNHWNRESHPLAPARGGVWQLRLPPHTLQHGQTFKLHIHGADDSRLDRLPACLTCTSQDPVTHDFSGRIWNPPLPYPWRSTFNPASITTPLIYEAHVGMSGEEGRVHSYREFANTTIPRIAAAGYNTIQLMAVQEHPYYGSFGYHVSSFFAPSSRFGSPDDLKYLIDTAHSLGLAVLLDVVHSHAVKNTAEGLNRLDGSDHLYFHPDHRGDHPQWDSKCFDYSRPEVRRFLLSNLRYWLEEFHFDGFRFDGITSMLYWHRGLSSFDHYGSYFGPDTDPDAVLYLQLASTLVRRLKPGALLIAEDMSGMPGLCRPVDEGGIGFSHRLAMGVPDFWIKLLKHSRDEDWDLHQIWNTLTNRRRLEPNIAYAESHDQALVGDKTLAFWLMDQEMYWHMGATDPHPVIDRGIALHKIIRLLTYSLAGEGWLNFMGNEFGHPEWLDFPRAGNDWSFHYCRRQWSLVDNPALKYHFLAAFDRAMLHLAALGIPGTDPAQAISIDPSRHLLIAQRHGLLFVFNLSVQDSYPKLQVDVSHPGPFRIILNTDDAAFGGHHRVDSSIDYPVDANGQLTLYSPQRTALVLAPA